MNQPINMTILSDNEPINLQISSQGKGTSNYEELTNKPTINNVELIGNKTTSDLGIVIPEIPTNVSAFNNDAGYLTQHQDISGKLDTSKVKSAYSTTSGDVYDVSYINSTIGDIETLLGGI